MVGTFGAAKTDFDAIPVIDVSGLGDPVKRPEISRALVAAAETAGFFYVSGHGIAQSDMENAMAASKQFFALPDAYKETVRVNTDQRGWMAQGMARLEGASTYDAKEVFFWGWDIAPDDPDLAAGVPMVALNQWPAPEISPLRAELMTYYLQAVDLGRKILSALAVGLGQTPNFFDTGYEKPLARGQLVYYPPSTDQDLEERRFGAAEHSDFGALTVLLQDMNGGLQVRNLAGDWIEAPPIEGAFVCNIGDLLERWTNKRLVSTKHRVLNTSGNERYSIPVFCDPSSQTLVDPKAFLRTGETPKFEPITVGQHIANRNKRNFSQYKSQSAVPKSITT